MIVYSYVGALRPFVDREFGTKESYRDSLTLAAGLRGFCAFRVGSFTPGAGPQLDHISLYASPEEHHLAASAIVVVGRKMITQKKFPQPPRHSSATSATTLSLGRGRIT
jgi:hypothetical protein